jgi:hypothetical protein
MRSSLLACTLALSLILPACGGSGNEPDRLPFTRSGTGNQVFDMPLDVERVRITGAFTGSSSNFIVWVGSDLVVNELLGTAFGPTSYEGTHQVEGGVTRVENSTGVAGSGLLWSPLPGFKIPRHYPKGIKPKPKPRERGVY